MSENSASDNAKRPSMDSLTTEPAVSEQQTPRLRELFLLWPHFLRDVVSSFPLWCSICLGCEGIIAWDSRHGVNPDGLSYLDIASGFLSGGASKLVNGYWSPGYPALIGVGLRIFRPTPSQEIPLVHLVNFAIFTLTLCSFSFFLRCWLSLMFRANSLSDGSERYIIPFAFCTFLWFMLEFTRIDLLTPDLCVAAIVFLAAGIACDLCRPGSTAVNYATLGCVLGLGYYAKAAMLPLGFAFLVVLFLCPGSTGVRRQKLLLSAAVFLFVAAPLAAVLSSREGRLSFGEAGSLNYAWYVDRLPPVGWTGNSSDVNHLPTLGGTGNSHDISGVPEHPPRTLMEDPLTLEFTYPIGGTYPLWSDPSYWSAGVKVRFDLRQQVAAVKETLLSYGDIVLRTAPFFGGALGLLVLRLRERASSAKAGNVWWQLAWPFSACLMYVVVHVEARFLGPFLVLFWLGLYGIAMRRLNGWKVAPILFAVLCTLMVAPTGQILRTGARTLRDSFRPRQQPDYEIVAARLRDLGTVKGDRVALVGNAFWPSYNYPYYARAQSLRVIAQIPDANEFWGLSADRLKSVTDNLAAIGVRAVVATDRPARSAPANWRDVTASGGVRFSILLLSEWQPASRTH